MRIYFWNIYVCCHRLHIKVLNNVYVLCSIHCVHAIIDFISIITRLTRSDSILTLSIIVLILPKVLVGVFAGTLMGLFWNYVYCSYCPFICKHICNTQIASFLEIRDYSGIGYTLLHQLLLIFLH